MELETLKGIMKEILNVDESEIHEETTFVGDLGVDSLDAFQIVMEIEEVFCIEISAKKAEKINTVKDALELIKELRRNKTDIK